MNFADLRKNLKKDFLDLKPLKIAVAADWAVQMLSQAVRGCGFEYGLNLLIYEAAYDQMESELFDPDSELYKFQPEYILIFPCAEKFQEKFYRVEESQRSKAVELELARISQFCKNATAFSSSRVIVCNYCDINDGVYGNYGGIFHGSLLYNLRRMNVELANLVSTEKSFLIDVNWLQAHLGRKNSFDSRMYYLTKTVFSLEMLTLLADNICSVISTSQGKIKKCLVVDLDNTIWGGIIGDDGLNGIKIGELGIGNAFSELQKWIKELSKRGIAIAICSKNNEDVAKEPFLKHPDMVLKLEDISVFLANWEDKATNIMRIKEILNIGMDSIVFIDDNPFERELVKSLLPEVEVPELPKEPTEYLGYLKSLNLFETVKVSGEDKMRTKQYQEEALRNKEKLNAQGIEAYLRNLNMVAEIKEVDSYSMPRVAQLTQRSNQFNLRTKRYTEKNIENILQDKGKYIARTISITDKFGEYGIICVAILEKISQDTLFVDTLLMSCRVLKRSVEEFVFNLLVEIASSGGFKYIEGEYIPTAKNAMVSELFHSFGFEKQEGTSHAKPEGVTSWKLNIETYIPHTTYVNAVEEN